MATSAKLPAGRTAISSNGCPGWALNGKGV